MTLKDRCGCPAGRPLGAPHLPTCEEASSQDVAGVELPKVVQLYRNPDTQQPIAVPDEIVSAAERDYAAWKTHTSGAPWTIVAEQHQYPSAEAAREAVSRYLEEAVAVIRGFTREQMVADHVGRLAAYRSALWTKAMQGNTQAIAMGLNIEDRWVKAFALDQADAEDTSGRTVVVASEEYIAELQAAAEAEPDAAAG